MPPKSREQLLEMARKGGQTTKARYGAAHYKEIGSLGGKAKLGTPVKRKRIPPPPLDSPKEESAPSMEQTLDEIIKELES